MSVDCVDLYGEGELMPISEVYRFVFRIETQCISHIDPVTVACGKTGIDRYHI